jgi:hypothetical protein
MRELKLTMSGIKASFFLTLTDPTILKTDLIATCGDWSPDGNYFAVAGEFNPVKLTPAARTSVIRLNKVVLYSAAGQVSFNI